MESREDQEKTDVVLFRNLIIKGYDHFSHHSSQPRHQRRFLIICKKKKDSDQNDCAPAQSHQNRPQFSYIMYEYECRYAKSGYERDATKQNKAACAPAKTQIQLAIRPVSSESSLLKEIADTLSYPLSAQRNSDHARRTPRLI